MLEGGEGEAGWAKVKVGGECLRVGKAKQGGQGQGREGGSA